VVIISNFKFWN